MSYLSPVKDAQIPKSATPEPRLVVPAAANASPEMVTTFGRGTLITGNIICAGAVQVFGRVTGEIHASHVVITEGAKVEGKLMVQEAVIHGTFKGTIHGSSVKLQGTAVVEGEIFNRSLTIEQNALFEGVSRRLERPVDAPTMEQITGGDAPSVAPAENAGFKSAPMQVGMDTELFA